jgi:hypothetical protein
VSGPGRSEWVASESTAIEVSSGNLLITFVSFDLFRVKKKKKKKKKGCERNGDSYSEKNETLKVEQSCV